MATASTSTLPSPAAHRTSPAQVSSDLEAARNPASASDETWADATESSLLWLLSLGSATRSDFNGKGKGREEIVHWFCGSDGAEECWESAVFSIRLLSFKRQGEVGVWRDQFDRIMLSCCDCVREYQKAKIEFKERYLLVLKTDKAIESFIDGVERSEYNAVLKALVNAGLSTPTPSHPSYIPSQTASLRAAPAAAIYNCLVNSFLFQRYDIVDTLASGLPIAAPLDLPPIVSPGLLALLLHSSLALREWAQMQLDACDVVSAEQYATNRLGVVIDSHLGVLGSRDREADGEASSGIRFDYTVQRRPFWQGLAATLAVLSPDSIRANLVRRGPLDVVHFVTGHVADAGDHLEAVLAAFKILLSSLGAHFWAAGDDDYAETVLHSLLDNPDFERAFVELSSGSPDQPFLDWLPPFLTSVAHSPELFPKTLAIVTSTFLDRFQKLRFDPSPRTIAIQLAVNVLTEIFVTETRATSMTFEPIVVRWPHARDAAKVLDLHAGFLAQLAFTSEYAKEPWTKASHAAVVFVGKVAEKDGRGLAENVYTLARYGQAVKDEEARTRAEEKAALRKGAAKDKASTSRPTSVAPALPPPPAPFVYAQAIWDRSYELIKDTDARGIGILLRAVSSSAHLEKLSSRTWTIKTLARTQMMAVNDAMEHLRQPLIPLLMSLADERTDLLLTFLSQPGIGDHLALLLLSPIEEVHNTAQGLVKQAFDVTTRRECFRSLLFQLPDATLRGLSHGVRAFVKTSKLLPEACGMAKRVVRCLSDVIDVLCGATDGLLRDASFLARSKDAGVQRKLVSFWQLMCEALALLFKMTPEWATFFENDQMTEWMRDAILFGVDLLDQFRTFEMSASGAMVAGSISSPAKMSNVGQKMIAALNDPLEELIAWLRLNDEDLLSSTFGLVRGMLDRFARSAVALRPTTLAKIRRITERETRIRAGSAPKSSILRDDQLQELLASLESQDAEGADSEVDARKSDASSKQSHKDWWAKASASSTKVKGFKSTSQIEIIEIDDDDDEPAHVKKKASSSASSSRPSSSHPPSTSSRLNGSSGVFVAPSVAYKFPFGSSAAGKPPPKPQGRPLVDTKPKGPNFSVPAMRNAARPRGVPWTTYSSKATAETSEESSSDEEEDGDTKVSGLQLLAKAQKSPKIKKTVERRTVKLLDDPSINDARGGKLFGGRSRRDQQQNSARLRGAQDFAPLHRQILQWDCKHTGSLPPNMHQHPRGIPSSFASPEAYFAAFEPLLLTECWEQIKVAKVDYSKETQPVSCDIAGRQAVDDFTDIFLTVDHGKVPDKMWFGDADLVLLRQGPRQILAKVQTYGRKREFCEITLRCHFGNDLYDVGPALSARTKWEMVKLYNLSTIHREYSALQSLRYLDLCNDILSPRPPPILEPDPRAIADTMKAYEVNKPQAAAILGSLKNRGFSLIQGPPGTGKTKTIVGLIGAFIDSRPRPASAIRVGQASDPLAAEPVPKVLLCAPSNAAVDEVAKRLKDGIRGSDGKLFMPKIVRIGTDSSVDISVKDIFLDELVEREMSGTSAGASSTATAAQASMHAMRAEVDAQRAERDLKRTELDMMDNNDARKAQLVVEFKKTKARIFDLSQRLDQEKDKAQQSRRAMDAQQRKIRLKILSEADVICATLSGSGHDYMAQLPFDFETVIIDEAAQSIELSSLIPLKYGCRRCILVGDPLQLPPTVISRAAGSAGYERSLFVRVMERGGAGSVHLLSIQYRMNPHISAFPSTAFYHSRLTDGPGMEAKTLQPWHANSLFPPYAFMHVRGGNEVAGRHHSLTNPQEAATALAIYERLLREYPAIDFDYRIGVVTPYKGQVGELKRQFRNRFGLDILSKVSFNTVDGFQGQEKDIIILSCVRGGSAEGSVGFLADTRRMNVALTRARSSLFILGDSQKLRSNQYWANLVGDAEARGLLTQVDPSTFRSLALSAPPVIRASASTSHAAPIIIAPRAIAPLQTLKEIYAQSTGAGTGGGIKRRVSEMMELNGAEKKRKVEEELEEGEVGPNGEVGGAPVVAPPALTVPAATSAVPPAPVVRKKKPASLFVPKKRPAGGPPAGGSAKKPFGS